MLERTIGFEGLHCQWEINQPQIKIIKKEKKKLTRCIIYHSIKIYVLIQYNNITQMLTSLHRVYLSAAWKKMFERRKRMNSKQQWMMSKIIIF